MTETTTFPFPSLQEDPQGPDGEQDRGRLALVLGGGLLAVALVGGAVFALSGSDELPVDSGVSTTRATASGDQPAAAELEQTVPSANTESIARNPFEPKYVEPAPVPETPVADTTTDPAAVPPVLVIPDQDGVPVTTTVGVLVPPGSAGQPTGPNSAPTTVPREYRLVLTAVSTEGDVPVAEFTIDGAVSKVKATEIFGPSSQLLLRSLQQGPKDGQWTATIQVGDARPIDVVTGNAVYVQ